jgi:hypothetical protein
MIGLPPTSSASSVALVRRPIWSFRPQLRTPNHLRQQGYRERKRRGAKIVKINVSLAQIEGLELAGYLAPGTELSEALEQFFSDSISEWLQT